MSEEKSSERSKGQQKKRGGVDVLYAMSVTAAVFHVERSALNKGSDINAVGGCRCRVWLVQSKNLIKTSNVKRKQNGSEWSEFK